jgi:hypothetical protein
MHVQSQKPDPTAADGAQRQQHTPYAGLAQDGKPALRLLLGVEHLVLRHFTDSRSLPCSPRWSVTAAALLPFRDRCG